MKVSELGWPSFLQQWSDHVLDRVRLVEWLCKSPLAQEALATGYLGYPGASLAEVVASGIPKVQPLAERLLFHIHGN